MIYVFTLDGLYHMANLHQTISYLKSFMPIGSISERWKKTLPFFESFWREIRKTYILFKSSSTQMIIFIN